MGRNPAITGVAGEPTYSYTASADELVIKSGVRFTKEQRKLNPVGTYSRTSVKRSGYRRDPGMFSFWSCDNLPNGLFELGSYSSEYNELNTNLWKKLTDDIKSAGSANLLVFAKEFDGTLNMLLARVVQAQRGVRALLSRNPNAIRRFLLEMKSAPRVAKSGSGSKVFVPKKLSIHKTLADNWLEYSFGFKPLIEDINQCLKALTSRPETTSHVLVVKTGTSFDDDTLDEVNTFKKSTQLSLRYQCNVRISDPNVHLANRMGFLNPLEAIWEIIPFSFAVDYFANVGDLVSSLSALAGVEITDGQQAFMMKASHSYHTQFQINGAPAVTAATYNCVNFSRTVSVPPSPTLALSSPLGGPMRAANQIAVLTSLLKK